MNQSNIYIYIYIYNLTNINWSFILTQSDIHISFKNFISTLTNSYNICCPLKKVKIKSAV